MYQYRKIYEAYFARYRAKGSKQLKPATIDSRIRKIIEDMNERDRHILMLLGTYRYVDHIAKIEEKSVKKISQQIDIALNHLITPANVMDVCGTSFFKHHGKSLSTYNLSKRTLNALNKKSSIYTDGDLRKWLSYGSYQLFRLPGIGKAGIAELMPLMYILK